MGKEQKQFNKLPVFPQEYAAGIKIGRSKERYYIINKIEKLIVEEMLIARKEGKPTSRLTSLANKITKLKKE